MQNRLGIPTSAGASDVNLGCSGFVYSVGLAKALIENGQARNVLFVTAETYSKFIHHKDRSVRTLFGDAGAATLLSGVAGPEELIGPFVYGTDGCGAQNLIVRMGGLRHTVLSRRDEAMVECGSPVPTDANLYMNGPEIFNFTLRVVPKAVAEELSRAGKKLEDIDLFVFHQANQYMLEHLRKKLKIRSERFFIGMRHCGNTVSCTIPIALKQAADVGRLRRGDLVMLVGFGVGYSWGATLLRWI
jgi:3-oxoacyl-[acyl-carrier-protein] synthase-3